MVLLLETSHTRRALKCPVQALKDLQRHPSRTLHRHVEIICDYRFVKEEFMIKKTYPQQTARVVPRDEASPPERFYPGSSAKGVES